MQLLCPPGISEYVIHQSTSSSAAHILASKQEVRVIGGPYCKSHTSLRADTVESHIWDLGGFDVCRAGYVQPLPRLDDLLIKPFPLQVSLLVSHILILTSAHSAQQFNDGE